MPTVKIKKDGKWEYAATPAHAHKASDITDLNIDIPSVSDTYDETSSDAMSGKAVAEALQTISIPEAYEHPETHPATMITGLASVATSGSYNDLSDKPTIPSIDGLATEEYVDEKISSIKIPEIPEATFEQVQADWDEIDTTSPAYIKNKPTISGDGSASVQANWTQVDSAAADFIKNKPFGEEELKECLQTEEGLQFTYSSDFGVFAHSVPVAPFTLEADCEYVIVWDCKEYTRTSFAFVAPNGAECIGVGNPLAAGQAPNEDLFCIVYDKTYNYIQYLSLEQVSTHTIGIFKSQFIVTKIDPKYLPDGIGGGSSLPEVTTSDAGKFLRVSADGLWVAESIPNAEEASF